jgi:hypothetical protein
MKMGCRCQLCSAPIEFESTDAGKTIACPSCGMDTQLYVVQRNFAAMNDQAKGKAPAPTSATGVTRSTLICSYLLAFLIPLAGFFSGLYLILKKETGHGVTCMGLSVVMPLLYWAVLSML